MFQNLKLNLNILEEQELVDIIAEFRKAYAAKEIDNEGYISFLKSYGEYLIIEKPTTWDNLVLCLNTNLVTCIGDI
jgi:hypothetical protein